MSYVDSGCGMFVRVWGYYSSIGHLDLKAILHVHSFVTADHITMMQTKVHLSSSIYVSVVMIVCDGHIPNRQHN